jgi:sterol desaturase/sphingolipid hydroxylase (fatty acid hydroxylase superfamily)
MNEEKRLQLLKVALNVVGVLYIVGIYAMMMWIWPSGWGWEPRQPEYEQMIMGVYATLGVFLIRAAKNPIEHQSLIWFTIWSSLVHAIIMTVQALLDPTDRINLLGDIPALYLIAGVLWYLMPKGQSGTAGGAR